MSRSGSLAAWEQRLAAQRREDDRLARERRQRDKEAERLRQAEHAEARQREAEEKTAALAERMKALGEVLTSALALPPLSFARLLATPRTPDFDPGPLGAAPAAPDWADYAPAAPAGLGRLLGGGARHAREVDQARTRYDAAVSEHQRAETERRQALAAAKARHDRKVTEERAKTAARNAYVAGRESAFAAGDPAAVEWFTGCVLRASRYPEGFPREHTVTYHPGRREVAVDFELPPRTVVPAERACRYVRTRDAVEPVPRSEADIAQCHDRLVASIVLRTLHEIFAATPPGVVAAITFTGRVAAVDRATGHPIHLTVVTVSTTRPAFTTLVLSQVDPVTCLAHLTPQPTLT